METIYGSTSSQYWSHCIDVYESDLSVINNTSAITVKVYIGRYSDAGASYFWGANWNFTVNCTGVASQSFNYSNSERVDVAAGAWVYVGEVTFYNVPHNADGSKTVTISDSFSGSGVSPNSGSASGQFALTTIDRAAPTITTTATVNSDGKIKVDCTSNATCDSWQYSLDNGSWTTFSTTQARSASTTLSVSEGTHTVKVKARRVYNNVVGTGTAKTVDTAKPIVTTTATVNSDGRIKVSGSANVNCNVWEYSLDNGSWAIFSTTDGKSASEILSVSEGTHTVNVRAWKTSNNRYGTGTTQTVDTAKPTVSLEVVEVLVNQITIAITSNAYCDRWEYSLDSGATWVVAFTTTYQGKLVFKIEDLQPNTFYIIAARARKASNGLYVQSESRNVKTLGGATYVSDGKKYKKAICYINFGNLAVRSEEFDRILSEDGIIIACEDNNGGQGFKAAMPYIFTLDGWKTTEY